MERIALISDIHANLYAFEALMHELDADHSISRILNMGDFIQIGPNPKEVFDRVMNDGRFINILGNSEYMLINEEARKKYLSEETHQVWTAAQVGKEQVERLREIPLTRMVTVENKTLMMIHARTHSPLETPLLYDHKPLEAFLSDYEQKADYVLMGHTHLPLYAPHFFYKPIINPGSVGCGKDGIVRFALMEIEDGLVQVSYRQVKYDKEKVIAAYRKKDVPCMEKFISMFY